jgi:hypothetical protein
MRNAHKILVGKFEAKRPLGALGVEGRTIAKCILTKYGVRVGTGFIWHRIMFNDGFLRRR